MRRLRKQLTSPVVSIVGGYVYIGCFAIFLYTQGFYEESTLFTWGVPVTFMGKVVEDESTYYLILCFLFVHQLINNWVNDVAYPWVINNVQNKESKTLLYSRQTTILVINMFDIYSELDMILLVSGMASQIGFFMTLLAANLVASTAINWQYIKLKDEEREPTELDAILII